VTTDATVTPRDSSTLQSVERACVVLEHLASSKEPQTVSQVSRALGIERTATHRLLRSLLRSGLLRSERGGAYAIGPRSLAIGMSYVEQMQVWRLAIPFLMELTVEWSQRPWVTVLAVYDGREILLLERVWTPLTPLDAVFEIGGRMPVDRTAAGWAYLAQLADAEVVDIVGKQRFREIKPKLEQARQCGLAFASSELQPGIDALSAAIVDGSGRAAALLIVGGTEFHDQLHPDSPAAQRVLRIASRISANLASGRFPA
jgi:DNA-binding IclR family transcriptional regulator